MRTSGSDHHAVHSRSLEVDHFLFVLFVLLDLERFGNVGLPHGGLDLVQLCAGSSATSKMGMCLASVLAAMTCSRAVAACG